MSHAQTTAADELRFRLKGELFEPGSAGYDDTCTLFNSMIQRRPALVARCVSPDDVVAALAFGREQGLEIAVRSGGHSVSGKSLNDGGLVIDLRGIDHVEVDPAARTARVGGGATWSKVDRATQEHGLATTGGRVSSTGVGGLTLGGGSGWIERKFGLTCDNLIGAQVVTAAGEIVRASAEENPELLWALRGGGGNFGVVTELTFALHSVGPEVLAGLVLHPAERAAELLRLFRDLHEDAPDELGLAFAALTAPDEPDIPADLRGKPAVAIAGLYAGDVAEGEKALAEIRAFGPPAADFFGVVPYADFQCSLDDPPGYRNYWTEEHLSELPDDAVDAIVARAAEMPLGPAQLFIVPWGGAVGRAPEGSSPLGGRDAKFIVHPLLLWEDPADDQRVIEHGRAYHEDLKPWATGATYLNFIGDEGAGRIYSGFAKGAYERLEALKAEWDPDNVFRGNQNIRPAVAP